MSDSPLYNPSPRSATFTKASGAVALTCSLALFGAFAGLSSAQAATPPVGLGTADSYSVLAGSTVTNTGASTLQGDLGVSPGTAITGFPPGIVVGTSHSADAPALQAQSDLVTAYNDVAGRASTAVVSGDLVGRTLVDGVYKSATTLDLSGTLTLDGQGDPSSVFVFQVGSALTTASASRINLINGASACNVYWQVGSSATLGTGSSFKGTVMALTSVSVTTGAVVEGRALARNGQVSLDTNVFTTPSCAVALPVIVSPSPSASPSATVSPSPSASPSATVSSSPSASPSATVSSSPSASPSAPVPPVSTDGGSSWPSTPVTTLGKDSGPESSTGQLADTGAAISILAWAGGIALLVGTILLGFPMARRVQARSKH